MKDNDYKGIHLTTWTIHILTEPHGILYIILTSGYTLALLCVDVQLPWHTIMDFHNNWPFVISDSDEWTQFITMWRTTWQSFPHSQPTFLHIIIPYWQLTVSMHQIGSFICNEHKKLMVKMTILFLLCACMHICTLNAY